MIVANLEGPGFSLRVWDPDGHGRPLEDLDEDPLVQDPARLGLQEAGPLAAIGEEVGRSDGEVAGTPVKEKKIWASLISAISSG